MDSSIFTKEVYQCNNKEHLCSPTKLKVKMKAFDPDNYEVLFKAKTTREYFLQKLLKMPKWESEIKLPESVFQNLT